MTEKLSTEIKFKLRDLGNWLIEISENEVKTNGNSDFVPAIPLPNESEPTRINDEILLSRIAKYEYNERRRRSKFIAEEYLGEPAWDMLLDLFVARVAGRQISVTSACLASGVPPTTALRWIEALQRNGHVTRARDPIDGRRHWVELTNSGYRMVGKYLKGRANHLVGGQIGFAVPMTRTNK